MRPGRQRYSRRDLASLLSPAEQLVEQLDPTPDEERIVPLAEEDEADPIPLWEPKGLTQTGAQVTVEGEHLRFSPPPPRTAGGSAPGTKKPLGQFGPEGT